MQSAVAAAGAFLLIRWLGLAEEFVGVLSAVLVVQPSVGHTLGAAKDRFLATVVGSAVGVVCLALLPRGYGTAAALAVSMLVMNAIAGFRPQWRYGTVAAVALALGSDGDAWQTAQDRAIAIGGGALFGAAVSFVAWPDSASKRAQRHLRSALRATAERFETAMSSARGDEQDDGEEASRRFQRNLESARDAAEGILFADRERTAKAIGATERLYNSVLILHRVAEETDEAVQGISELETLVDDLKELGCEATVAIAEGEHDQSSAVEKMRHLLEQARRRLRSEDAEDPRAHLMNATVVFGLGEIADSLEELSEVRAD